jgi:hypothetical protein
VVIEMDLLSLLGAIVHSSAHPDTAFITVSSAGYSGLALYWMVMGISSLATIILFYGNQIFISGIGSRLSFLVKMRNFLNRKVERVGYIGVACSLVKKSRYIGLAIVSFVPIIVGAREASLFVAQALGMNYALPVALLANGFRLYLLYVFGPAIWQAAILNLFNLLALVKVFFI